MIDNYHKDTTRISKSGLDLINQSPKKYWYKYLSGDYNEKPSKALIEGRAFHEFILEPEKFAQNFVIMPEFKGKGSQFARENWIEENSHKDFITSDQYKMILGMNESVFKHPKLKQLLSSGSPEETWLWTDQFTGVECKARSDWRSDMDMFVDLKSTEDASVVGFSKSILKFRYHVQEAFYTDGARENGFNPKAFIFAAVEKSPPYLVKLHVISDEFQDFGRECYRENLIKYKECKDSGVWTGYGQDINQVELPNYLQF